MKSLAELLERAAHSDFQLWLLNNILLYKIPFNHTHKLRITGVHSSGVTVVLPFRRSNLNHLKGLHACALATLCEYTAGLSLQRVISGDNYRLIMKNLHMEYHYQGKSSASAMLELDPTWVDEKIRKPLQSNAVADIEIRVHAFDEQKNMLCTADVDWQIKHWDQVRTK